MDKRTNSNWHSDFRFVDGDTARPRIDVPWIEEKEEEVNGQRRYDWSRPKADDRTFRSHSCCLDFRLRIPRSRDESSRCLPLCSNDHLEDGLLQSLTIGRSKSSLFFLLPFSFRSKRRISSKFILLWFFPVEFRLGTSIKILNISEKVSHEEGKFTIRIVPENRTLFDARVFP